MQEKYYIMSTTTKLGNFTMYAVTLMCNPSQPILTKKLISKYYSIFEGSSLIWLRDGIAAEIKTTTFPQEFSKHRINLQKLNIDSVLQKDESRKKKLLIADMDSTIIEQECLDELATEVGFEEEIKKITKAAMNGEINFETALRNRVCYLKGAPISTIANVLTNRISISSGARTLLATMKKNNVYTALISGGFTHFTSHIAADLGFDKHMGNQLEISDSKLTGSVKEPILGKEAKVELLESLSKNLKVSYQHIISVGDGANDIGMLKLAGLGVALHAKPIVQSEANTIINHCDLTALLYLQGYHFNDFIY